MTDEQKKPDKGSGRRNPLVPRDRKDAEEPDASKSPAKLDFSVVEHDVKRAQNFIVAGGAFGFLAVFMGSLLLGAIGLALSIMGLRKTRALEPSETLMDYTLKKMRGVAYFAIVLNALAIVLSVVYLAIYVPYLIELAESGQLDALLEEYAASSSATTNSTWG